MELIRKILFKIESFPSDRKPEFIEIKGYNNDKVMYNISTLYEGGFIRVIDVSDINNIIPKYKPISLTWEGHELLDEMRSDKIWNKTKEILKNGLNAVGITILKLTLHEVIKNNIGIFKN